MIPTLYDNALFSNLTTFLTTLRLRVFARDFNQNVITYSSFSNKVAKIVLEKRKPSGSLSRIV